MNLKSKKKTQRKRIILFRNCCFGKYTSLTGYNKCRRFEKKITSRIIAIGSRMK